jgi:hypothetical protein
MPIIIPAENAGEQLEKYLKKSHQKRTGDGFLVFEELQEWIGKRRRCRMFSGQRLKKYKSYNNESRDKDYRRVHHVLKKMGHFNPLLFSNGFDH